MIIPATGTTTLEGGTVEVAGTGTLSISGTLVWGNFGSLNGAGTTTIANGSTITVNPGASGQVYLGSDGSNHTLAIASGASLDWSSGSIFMAGGSQITNAGTFTANSEDGSQLAQAFDFLDPAPTLVNTGTVQRTAGSGTTSIRVAVQNDGTIRVSTGVLNLTGPLTNYSPGSKTLTGGTYEVFSPGLLRITELDVVTNAATIVLDGIDAALEDQSEQDALRNLATNSATGSLTIRNGKSQSVAALTNAGAVAVGSAATLTANGYTQTGGTTTLVAGSANVIASGTNSISIDGGTLAGVGTLQANGGGAATVTNNGGTIQPGLSGPGTLSVTGSFSQGANGTLEIDVNGPTAGTQFDVLQVSSSAIVGGTLTIQNGASHDPPVGSTFEIITAGSRSGTFAAVQNVDLAGGKFYEVQYNPTNVRLVVAQRSVTHHLTVSKAGTGTGTVTSAPAGITCGATCEADFGDGTSVVLTATPDAGSVFTGWTGDCTGTGACTLTMSADHTVTATFDTAPPVTHHLTVSKAGTGTGTVTSAPAGITCGATCEADFGDGTSVVLTATPDAGSVFTGWTGDCTGTGACTLTMSADHTVTATFDTAPPVTHHLTVSKAGTGTGTVTSAPAGITCGATCEADFGDGTSVVLTATPDAGSVFTGWTGDCTGTGACTLTMSAAHTVTATFDTAPPVTHHLTVSKAGTGTGTVTSAPAGITCGATCEADFGDGTSVVLTATPDAGSVFTGWTGDCTGTGACTLTMSADHTVTATFDTAPPVTHHLTVSKAGTGTGTVTSAPAGITCGATCEADFGDGTSVVLTATPDAGSVFTGWTGDCTGTGACTLTMSADHTVTATFDTAPPIPPPDGLQGRHRHRDGHERAGRDHVRGDLRGRLRRRDLRRVDGHPRRGLGLHRLDRGLHRHRGLHPDDVGRPHRHGDLR